MATSSQSRNLIVILTIATSLSITDARNLVRAAYWNVADNGPPLAGGGINAALYTHLICGFATVNQSTYKISIPPSDEPYFADFTSTVRRQNPSVTTLISITGDANASAAMLNDSSRREIFIWGAIRTARRHGFGGVDLFWSSYDSPDDVANVGALFKEWRVVIDSEAGTERKLLLTATVDYAPRLRVGNFEGSIRDCLDWIHVMTPDFSSSWAAEPGPPLNDPGFSSAIRSGIEAWTANLPPEKLVLSLPFYGYAWKLANPTKGNRIGAPLSGPAVNEEWEGFLSFREIKEFTRGAEIFYNSTSQVNYCTVEGSVSAMFEGPEAIRARVSYTTEMNLGGYCVWETTYDDDGELARVAAEEQGENRRQVKKRDIVLAGTIAVGASITIILCIAAFYCIRIRGAQGFNVLLWGGSTSSLSVQDVEGSGVLGRNDTVPNLRLYSFEEINKATNRFCVQNKLGRGGYGPVYKGVLPDGQEIAVKKLSQTSTQGLQEFKNEVQLSARIQHVNLVRVLGYCIDKDEKMLVYEFMPNNSLEKYLYDPTKRNVLDWNKRVEIIQGITQGLVYLQEYSRLPIIHRDLKASNILLDSDFLPKISDFGIAKVFSKNGDDPNTVRIVGTIGYTPPEYFRQGTYSVKSDVYSFGILLLQVITSKKIAPIYGPTGVSSLQEHAFELWQDERGMEIMDPSLDDSMSSSCKLLTCLTIALLCVQDDPVDRPSMLEVASMLRSETVVGSLVPKRPKFSFKRHQVIQMEQQQGENLEGNNVVLQPEFCSIADATVTEIEGR